MKLTCLFETKKWSVDECAARIEDDDLLLDPHCENREIRRGDSQAGEENGEKHPESGSDQIVGDGVDGGKFHLP